MNAKSLEFIMKFLNFFILDVDVKDGVPTLTLLEETKLFDDMLKRCSLI